MKKGIVFLLAVFLIFSVTGCTIVRDEDAASAGVDENEKNAEAYVNELWDSSLFPYIDEKAVPVETFFEAYYEDPRKAEEEYGIVKALGAREYYVIVQGTVKVVEEKTDSKSGNYVKVDTGDYDGEADFTIQLGPVIKGSSVRDALDFIKANDFNNQVEYADVSSAFNKRVYSDVIQSVNLEGSTGKELSAAGVLKVTGNEIVMTPLALEMIS